MGAMHSGEAESSSGAMGAMHSGEAESSSGAMSALSAGEAAKQPMPPEKQESAQASALAAKLDGVVDVAMLRICFNHWGHATHVRNIEAENERLRLRFSGSLQQLLSQNFADAGAASVRSVMGSWKEEVRTSRRAKEQRLAATRLCQVLGRQQADIGGHIDSLLMHAVLSRWAQETTNKRQSEHLANIRAAEAQRRQALGNVLVAWGASSDTMFLMKLVHAWARMVDESKLKSLREKLHRETRELVDNAVIQWSCEAERSLLVEIFGYWNLHSALRRRASNELGRHANGRDELFEKMLLCWGAGDSRQLKYVVFRFWRHFCLEVALLAESQDVAGKVLMRWDADSDSILKQTVFRAWHVLVDHGIDLEKHQHVVDCALMHWGSDIESVVLRGTFSAYWRICTSGANVEMFASVLIRLDCKREEVLIQTAFGAWTHVCRENILIKKHGEVLNKSLTERGGNIDDVLLHRVVHTWVHYHRSAKNFRAISGVLIRLDFNHEEVYLIAAFRGWASAYCEHVLVQRHGDVLNKTLMEWGNNIDDVLLHDVFHAWVHLGKVKKGFGAMSSALIRMGCNHEETFLNAAYNGWLQFYRQRKMQKQQGHVVHHAVVMWSTDLAHILLLAGFQAWVKNHEGLKNADVIPCMLIRMGCTSNEVLLSAVTTAWLHVTQQKFLAKTHGDFLRKTVMQMGGRVDSVVLRGVLMAWVHWRKTMRNSSSLGSVLIRMGCSSEDVVLRTAFGGWLQLYLSHMLVARHGDVINKTLMKWGSDFDDVLQETVFRSWKQLLQTSRSFDMMGSVLVRLGCDSEDIMVSTAMRGWSQHMQQLIMKRKHGAQLAATLVQWGAHAAGALLEASFRSWAQVYREQAYANQHREIFDKAVLLWNNENDDVLRQTVVLTWRQAVVEIKLDRDHEDMLDKSLVILGVASADVIFKEVLRSWSKWAARVAAARAAATAAAPSMPAAHGRSASTAADVPTNAKALIPVWCSHYSRITHHYLPILRNAEYVRRDHNYRAMKAEEIVAAYHQ